MTKNRSEVIAAFSCVKQPFQSQYHDCLYIRGSQTRKVLVWIN